MPFGAKGLFLEMKQDAEAWSKKLKCGAALFRTRGERRGATPCRAAFSPCCSPGAPCQVPGVSHALGWHWVPRQELGTTRPRSDLLESGRGWGKAGPAPLSPQAQARPPPFPTPSTGPALPQVPGKEGGRCSHPNLQGCSQGLSLPSHPVGTSVLTGQGLGGHEMPI